MISPSATSPALTEQGFDNIFRTCGRDEQQGATIADFIAKKYPGKTVAIVHDKTAYGQGLANEVSKRFKKIGLKEKIYESISRGERDYGSLVAKLKENNINILVYGGYHTEAGLITRQMRDQRLNTILVSDDDMATREFWSITGGAGEGSFFTFNNDARKKTEAADAVKHLRASGFDPEGTTLYTYAAIQVLAESIKRAGMVDPKKAVAALHEGNYATVIGDISFDPKGDVTKPDYIIYQWTKGAYAPVEE